MSDLNEMMRIQARSGLQAQLNTAVTNGDAEAATKIADDIAKLAVQTAPKAPAFGDVEIRAELNKLDWFGVDPRKSAKVAELGRTMDPKKFATAEAFAAALVKAVDDDGKPAGSGKEDADEDAEGDEHEGAGGDDADDKPAVKKPRKTDGPGEMGAGATRRAASGPWTKISDAPTDIQKEVKRQADKFVSASAPKEQREKFITRALESHYAAHQRKTGKK